MNPLLYSPRLPQEYSRPTSEGYRAGIGAELQGDEHRALWNLYWLSDEAVDSFIGDWENGPRINMKMLAACGTALGQNSGGLLVRDLVLSSNPKDLVQHLLLHKHYYEHLAPYRLAGWSWVLSIQERSNFFRGVLSTDGSVVYANFGGASQKESVTAPGHSAKIMPLALKKS